MSRRAATPMTTSPALQLNTRMPFMPFNWFVHSTRVCRLSLLERGFFDVVRTELWTVVGCRMPREALCARLGITAGSPEAQMLDTLLTRGLLSQDEDGCVFDAVQVQEFAEAVRKAGVNRENGSKGGRPRRTAAAQAATDAGDF